MKNKRKKRILCKLSHRSYIQHILNIFSYYLHCLFFFPQAVSCHKLILQFCLSTVSFMSQYPIVRVLVPFCRFQKNISFPLSRRYNPSTKAVAFVILRFLSWAHVFLPISKKDSLFLRFN